MKVLLNAHRCDVLQQLCLPNGKNCVHEECNFSALLLGAGRNLGPCTHAESQRTSRLILKIFKWCPPAESLEPPLFEALTHSVFLGRPGLWRGNQILVLTPLQQADEGSHGGGRGRWKRKLQLSFANLFWDITCCIMHVRTVELCCKGACTHTRTPTPYSIFKQLLVAHPLADFLHTEPPPPACPLCASCSQQLPVLLPRMAGHRPSLH